ncbi:hypothetical protein BDV59DRAFT_177770 [Aspergillus ambiguus]|uniref:putative manganese ion homeostasis (Fr) n=1 Tax=Aspergillus ambiguus TaxID=176160 RepID=UPI003CCE1904
MQQTALSPSRGCITTMSYSYSHGTGSRAYRPAHPDHTSSSSNLWDAMQETVPVWAKQWVAEIQNPRIPWTLSGADSARGRMEMKSLVWRTIRCIFNIKNALILLWCFTLWWGERTVFRDTLATCAWGNWEKWPQDATPHHVAFIADPQLVDPHTYPGRPWPLSTLTIKFTDQYLRRSFSSIQRTFGPDSVVFLGDLFDGGREWGTRESSSPEKRYQKYKDSYWKDEYHRFVKIFADQWNDGDWATSDPRGRRMISSLPGNHDLGFGSGIQTPVRDRFQSFFGKGNRVDIIGNHTFVSIDTVSLSAMDQPDPETGSSGTGSGDGVKPNERIWKEPEEFLNDMKVHRGKAEAKELRMFRHQNEGHLFDHKVVDDVSEATLHQDTPLEESDFPAILLSHVPLYRKPGTPCGPLREHYPPSSNEELEEDDRNAITIGSGYQYQNVLTPSISKDLVTKVGPNLVHVYSGDDHDYCEISHREFSGSPKEITVKSLSWAMGVRRPGFVLTSLWNPIDPVTGHSSGQVRSGATVQNHLCLLPDQLSIFIHYGVVLGLTLVVLLARAVVRVKYLPSSGPTSPILPLSESRPFPPHPSVPKTPSSSPDEDDTDGSKWKPGRPGSSDRPLQRIRREFLSSVKSVAKIVFVWYFFLIWRW